MLEYKQLIKLPDRKIGSIVAQNNLQDLNKYVKKIIPKEPTHHFYSSKSITKEQETELPSHLRKFTTTKRRSLLCTIHRRRKSNQLPRINLHTNFWSHHIYTPSQQLRFHKRCSFHLHWLIKLLSHHSLQQQKWLWIFLDPWMGHPWIHHGRI